MRSSTGVHFVALDHVRAVAAFMVFSWHFLHYVDGFPIPFAYVPALPPFALLDEGQTGVALFMTLSGYLFAKLLDGKRIHYGAFLWNRVLRLLPLLFIVIAIVGAMLYRAGLDVAAYWGRMLQGFWAPTLPNGGWSITVEFHFYVVLPLLLWLVALSRAWLLAVVAAAVALRCWLYFDRDEVQSLAYWTVVGRIDQFVLGIFAFHFRGLWAGRHVRTWLVLGAFVVFYWLFDSLGGWYLMPAYPSSSHWWIVLPTIEGAAYGVAIAWYDSSYVPSRRGLSGFIARIGEYSYSIYLLHFFVVFQLARTVNKHVMDITEFYVACAWAFALFPLMIVPGYLSYRFIEAPFLRLRRRYVMEQEAR